MRARPNRNSGPACLPLTVRESGAVQCRAFEEDSLRISRPRIQAIESFGPALIGGVGMRVA
jgi:hypothetical protein